MGIKKSLSSYGKSATGFVAGVLVTAILSTGAVLASTGTKQLTANYSNIRIVLNGEQITPKDATGAVVEPFTVNGTTYLPVRAIANALNLAVDWDGETKTVFLGETKQSGNWSLDNPAPFGTSILIDYKSTIVESLTAKYTASIQEVLRGQAAYDELAKGAGLGNPKERLDKMLEPGKEFIIFKVGVSVAADSKNPVGVGLVEHGSSQNALYNGYGEKIMLASLVNYLPGGVNDEVKQGKSGSYWRGAVVDIGDLPVFNLGVAPSGWFSLKTKS
jgi:hypothetical protein